MIGFMNLSEYISLIGDKAASELFGIEQRTAASYRLGQRQPRPEVARTIVAVTNGKVTWPEVYAPIEAASTKDEAA